MRHGQTPRMTKQTPGNICINRFPAAFETENFGEPEAPPLHLRTISPHYS